MQIYNNHIPAGKYEKVIWRSGSMYLLRLTGINIIYGRQIDVLPVYSPMIVAERSKGAFRLEFAFNMKALRIMFLRRKPFIYCEIVLRGQENVYEMQEM